MAYYTARFMKVVLGENGRETEVCQRSVGVEASNERHAAELAKAKFCEAESVKNWLLHADRVQVADAEFPSYHPRVTDRDSPTNEAKILSELAHCCRRIADYQQNPDVLDMLHDVEQEFVQKAKIAERRNPKAAGLLGRSEHSNQSRYG
jgi:hypothetical protein